MLNSSCVPCQAKKLKCDGGHPCSNCTRKGIEGDCLRIARKARPRKSSTLYNRATTRGIRFSSDQSLDSVPSITPLGEYNEPREGTSSSLSPSIAVSQQDTLLNLAREALGDPKTCSTLIHRVFYWRVQSTCYACLDLASIEEDIKKIFSPPSPDIKSDQIVLCMMVIALSWQYFPKDGSVSLEKHMNLTDGKLTHRFRQKLLWEYTTSYTKHRMNKEDDDPSFAQVQTIILLLIYDHQSGNIMRNQLFDYAHRLAKRLGMHIIPMDSGLESKEEEIRIRAWWFLVARSWFTSLITSSYAIHPMHFSTRMTRHLAALDDHPDYDEEGSSYSPHQYGQVLIFLADMIRRLVDQRLSHAAQFGAEVERRFETFWGNLPTIYSASATSRRGDTVLDRVSRRSTSERWMLHQLIFHAYLELYQFDSAKPMPDACISLARHILNIQVQVDYFCVVLNSLRINITNIVKACCIIIVDLMQQPKRDVISRSIILAQVHQALSNCQSSSYSKPEDFQLITEMINSEAKMNGKEEIAAAPPYTSQLTFHDSSGQGVSLEAGEKPQWVNGATSYVSPAMEENTTNSASGTVYNDASSNDSLSWASLLPNERGIYPILQANTVEDEWEKAYESFLVMAFA